MPPRSHEQMQLRFPDPPGVSPAPGREEPALWVRRVAIWHDVANPPVRNFELKRGLNIIYSPTGDNPDALATGHAAGKTMLCRFIRYCLGEDTFADPEDTAEIRRKFPSGAVGVEFRVRGQTWIIRRPFASHQDVAVQAESFDALSTTSVEGEFAAFLVELKNASFDPEQCELLAEMGDVDDAWQYVLAWLTRDQECRIDGLLHWRHKDSSTRSSVRTANENTRLNVLRVALGLYSKTASDARKATTTAAARCDELRKEAQRAERHFEAVRDELAHALDVSPERIWPPPAELLQNESLAREAHQAALFEMTDQRIRSAPALSTDANLARDEELLPKHAAQLAQIAQEIDGLESTVDRQREGARLLENERAERWRAVREAKHPTCPYDGTPLDVEQARFVCPLPRLPDPAEARRVAEETNTSREKLLDELERNEGRLVELRRDHAGLREQIEKVRRRIEAHQLAVAAATSVSQSAWATKGIVRRLFEVRAAADEARAKERAAKDKLADLQERQKAGLSAFSTEKLQRWFDYLIRRVASPEAKGWIVLDGNGLHPRIDWRGRRRSVALNSLQIVLFDLAALLCAVEGDALSPAFLVHDSPREGDLDPHTYARIFRAIHELGEDEDLAPFQYIITTTTKPPKNVEGRVRLTIAADTARNRLLMEDL